MFKISKKDTYENIQSIIHHKDAMLFSDDLSVVTILPRNEVTPDFIIENPMYTHIVYGFTSPYEYSKYEVIQRRYNVYRTISAIRMIDPEDTYRIIKTLCSNNPLPEIDVSSFKNKLEIIDSDRKENMILARNKYMHLANVYTNIFYLSILRLLRRHRINKIHH